MSGKSRGLNTVALPELRRGRVAVCFATLLARSTGRPSPGIDYQTVAQAHAVARGQLAYYRALEAEGHVRILETVAQLDAHIAEWQAWDSTAARRGRRPHAAARFCHCHGGRRPDRLPRPA